MALDVMPTQRIARAQRRFEIHLGAEGLCPPLRLDHDVEREAAVLVARDGEADTVDRDGISDAGPDTALDDQAPVIERRHAPPLLDDPGEHRRKGYWRQREDGPLGPPSRSNARWDYALVRPVCWFRRMIATAITSRSATPKAVEAPIPASCQSKLFDVTDTTCCGTSDGSGPGTPLLRSEIAAVAC